ncbi:hypothetical protein, partial [Frankia sp. CiP3]|uniref:hypothetical protein n=1 Tax=Frankia sp. CiP3 TaxID=2880971 RepID=UPI001EF68E72
MTRRPDSVVSGGEISDKPPLRYGRRPLHVDLPPAIRNEALFDRALRPLSEPVQTPGPTGRDEKADALRLLTRDPRAFASGRPAEAPWDLALVVDASPTFRLAWADAVPGLVRVLARRSAFRDVVVSRLAADRSPTGRSRPRDAAPAEPRCRP